MEKITVKNFDKKCLLLKNGFRITGQGVNGIILRKVRTSAVPSLLFICGSCRFNGNGCNSNATEDSRTEIDAQIG
jgi:hypothetical protein